MSTHVVKSWTWLFRAIVSGRKTHDIRDMTERDYRVGDRMVLREWDQAQGGYTGWCQEVEITYITDRLTPCAFSSSVLARDYGILSVKRIGDLARWIGCHSVCGSLQRMCGGGSFT